ncbi:protein FAM133A-like [Phalaenopsis equestris]|uniref:protein FAM133A-like n=1 Tax=Phalaenopsis equestris TaxID=78828 RepID=UPI0009E59339|nr:protein FAM133A-like [Phalaenopsis equestris]
MGKNQAYKAMQRSRLSGQAGPEEFEDGRVDGTFHSPEWHAARLASLNTSHTITWEEFKKKQKEDELKKGEMEADKDRMMRDYRAQLEADRARKLAAGRNHPGIKLHGKKAKREKESKKRSHQRRKHRKRASDSSSCSSSSESSSSADDDDDRDSKRSRSKSRSKRTKEKRHRSKSKHSCSDSEASGGGPVRLSRFFNNMKS